MKDALPEQTMLKISHILNRLEIPISQPVTNEISSDIHSLRIEDLYLGAGTNGKGLTSESAVASAYGEFIERLQNGLLYINLHFERLSKDQGFFQDMQVIANDEMEEAESSLIDTMFKQCSEHHNPITKKLLMVPAFHVNSGTVRRIPIQLLRYLCGSNGMCAGNSPEEALVQGICEIHERFAMQEVYRNPTETYPEYSESLLRKLNLWGMVEEVREFGYSMRVKDVSIGGKIPVLAVIVEDLVSGKYKVSFGSDSHFSTALTRCITEVFQGHNLSKFKESLRRPLENRIVEFDIEQIKSMTRGGGVYPDKFIEKGDYLTTLPDSFSIEDKSNQEKLETLTQALISDNREIYIRDVSGFGFPAYFIYIPDYSENSLFVNEDIEVLPYVDRFMDIVHSGPKASVEDRKWAISFFRKSLRINSFKVAFDERENRRFIFSFLPGVEENSTELDNYFVMARMGHSVGDYRFVLECLNTLKEENPSIDVELLNLYSDYFRLKLSGARAEVIQNFQADKYGILWSECKETIECENKAFEYANYPECPQCDTCQYVSACKYPIWRKRMQSLKRHYQSVDQGNLLELFLKTTDCSEKC